MEKTTTPPEDTKSVKISKEDHFTLRMMSVHSYLTQKELVSQAVKLLAEDPEYRQYLQQANVSERP
jgi:hypothetical protein